MDSGPLDDKIENGVHGRDEIVTLARRLAGLDIQS